MDVWDFRDWAFCMAAQRRGLRIAFRRRRVAPCCLTRLRSTGRLSQSDNHTPFNLSLRAVSAPLAALQEQVAQSLEHMCLGFKLCLGEVLPGCPQGKQAAH